MKHFLTSNVKELSSLCCFCFFLLFILCMCVFFAVLVSFIFIYLFIHLFIAGERYTSPQTLLYNSEKEPI